jgi:hypothetical protein
MASARYTRGLTHEGPGVSISLVGGRNSSIGFLMTSNLGFHAASCRHIQKYALEVVCGPSKMLHSADKAIVPVAFRDISPKSLPNKLPANI